MKLERRFTNTEAGPVGIETREDGSRVLTGYGAVFYKKSGKGTEYRLWDDLVERIAPTAFDRALSESDDARGLFNHDPNKLLGRVSAKTMRLSVDKRGLKYEIDIPETTTGADVAMMVSRGDLTGSSFSFVPEKVTWTEEKKQEVRLIESVRLFDTGPVTYPAYDSTTTGVRSEGEIEDIRQERDAWKASLVKPEQIHKPGHML